jgi:hypothetical protein
VGTDTERAKTRNQSVRAIEKRRIRDLNRMRGEAVYWMTEIELELDELINYNLIKNEYRTAFFEALRWEDFRFSTKLRLFELLKLPPQLQELQKETCRELRDLSKVRNKFAHRSSFILEDQGSWLIDKRGLHEVDKGHLEVYRRRCVRALEALLQVDLELKGWKPDAIDEAKKHLIPYR